MRVEINMTCSHRLDLFLKGLRPPRPSTPPTSPEILKSQSQAISCPPLSGTALFILIVSDASPSIVNGLEFEVCAELLTAAIINIFVCDGDGGSTPVALRCAGNFSVKARFCARISMALLHDELRRHRSCRRHSIHPIRHRLIVRIILDAIDCVLVLLIDITGIAFPKLSTKFVRQAHAPMHTIVLGVVHVFVFISISGPKDIVDALYTNLMFYPDTNSLEHHWPPASKRLPIRVLMSVHRKEW